LSDRALRWRSAISAFTFQSVGRPSLFTRLDFRPKLVWESPLLGALLALIVLIACLAVGVHLHYVVKLLTVMLPFFLLMLITQGFFADDLIRSRTGQASLTPLFSLPDSWWAIGGTSMSVEGLLYALNSMAKTLTMMLVIPLVVFTTDLNTMIVGLVKARVPYKIAFIFSSTLRFFPLLFGDVQAIIEAQRLRGLAFETMGPIRRLRVYAKIAVPLILGAVVKSQQLEIVLQSKAFSGSPQRTYLHESRLAFADYAVLIFAVLFTVVAAVLYIVFDIGKFGGPL